MWELDHEESWTLKNWCFWTMVLEKTLESPLDCKRSNRSIPKEISPEYSLEGLMLKLELKTLATWCEELTHWKRPWCWERLKAGGEGDDRGWDGWMASLTLWTWVWVSSVSWWWTGRPGVLQFRGLQRIRHDWATELNWTDSIKILTLRVGSLKLLTHRVTQQFLWSLTQTLCITPHLSPSPVHQVCHQALLTPHPLHVPNTPSGLLGVTFTICELKGWIRSWIPGWDSSKSESLPPEMESWDQ